MASSDHAAGVKSIISGMSSGKRGHFIYISSTGILNDTSTVFGNPATKLYYDVADVQKVINLPETALHRDVDDAVIISGKSHNVPTAIVSPPTIYRVGEVLVKKRTIQIPFLNEAIVKRGKAFTFGDGNNIWDRT